jgi:hypothetical protein
MSFDLKSDLVFERLDSSVFEREEAVGDPTGEFHRMLTPFFLWESEVLARGTLSDFYPSDNRVTRSSFVKSTLAHSVRYSPDLRSLARLSNGRR